ncbi:hypothetical protein EJK55_2066 [Moraxella catarrhalis]|uniref:Uncharacterized protein n=1 Tax=Moraxella catarrhalis TaxID=480 RepID=A0A3Q9GD51_MORCA|nr:hypothetical protein MCR_1248 [Moraxella catarrhalis BBH18]AZQ86667.1 hypothetical protein EJK52_1297 [Moraxella catarrhalis]EKF83209.1 hypothetical protein MCRH_1318 [Moraxella catarrhalis RH4]AZQ89294.1 hypothetical protein EJK50_1360 [Moraxella catarrhalis]AZQ90453.1 hypothetical protein EJK51_1296 [Moraxella catarrhalis]
MYYFELLRFNDDKISSLNSIKLKNLLQFNCYYPPKNLDK